MAILEASEKDHYLETLKKAKSYKTRLLKISTSLVSGWGEVDKKSDKRDTSFDGCRQKSGATSSKFFFSIFSATHFFFFISHKALIISQSAAIKTHPTGYLYISDSYITRSKKLKFQIFSNVAC